MSDLTEQALRYNLWANLQLLDVCSKLSPDQLQLTSAGTYGTIADTWQHLLSAEQRYARRLIGFQPQITEKDEFPGIARLKEHAERSGAALIGAAGSVNPDDTTEAKRDDGVQLRISQWVVITQAIHHGNDHRTQICTILGQNGVSYGDIDVWAFGEASGGAVAC